MFRLYIAIIANILLYIRMCVNTMGTPCLKNDFFKFACFSSVKVSVCVCCDINNKSYNMLGEEQAPSGHLAGT